MSRITIISINFLIILAIGFFFVFPEYRNLKNLTTEVREKKAELQYKKEYYSNVKRISEELKKYESEISKIDSAFPSRPFLPSLFNFLEKTAIQNGLILKQIGKFSITPSKENLEIKNIYIEIIAGGSYPAFKNFLSALEKTARLVEVENIVFSSPTLEEEKLFSFELKIKTHSY